ncbi:MAG: glycosyl transferase family 2, partial [Bacteroidota bacterium]|nr:glycosyl transferase family 2 [Bacteroidota bacterium]
GCYAIRAAHYAPVPPKYFMDDFFITMNVLEQGKRSVMALEAECYEDVSNRISEEFRRKVRISIGNFQNLFRYKSLLWPPWTGIGYAFWSHKVLRWIGPFFIILALVSSGVLASQTLFFKIAFIVQLVMLCVPLMDAVLKKVNFHSRLLRFVSHFYLMNLALLVGFIKYAKGVESNIWKPTQRYQ